MNVWQWAILFLVQELPDLVSSQTCALYPATQPEPMYTDTLLDLFAISHLKGFKLARCVLECFLVKLCVSFNYREDVEVCTLNWRIASEADPDNLVANMTGYVYHELSAWSDDMAGTCSGRPCAENQRCIQTTPYMCVDVDCGPLLRLTYNFGVPPWQFTATTSTPSTTLGSKATFSCNDDWVLDWSSVNDSPLTTVCGSDYRWSPTNIECSSRIKTCADIKVCNSSYGDGHYLIPIPYDNNKHQILYCHDMAGFPRAYLTLWPYGSTSYYTGTGNVWPYTTLINKVRIYNNYKLNITDIFHEGSQTYAYTAGHMLGSAYSCPDRDGFAEFRLNITDTGFMLKPGTSWVGDRTSYEVQSLNITDTIAHGRCGGPVCGSCYPVDKLIPVVWQYNPTKAADGSDPIIPTCV